MSLVNLSHVCSHLQNASLARLGLTSIPYTRLHLKLSLLLHKQGFLSQVKLAGPSPPASCFPPGARDNQRVTAHPHSDRSQLSGESALLKLVSGGLEAEGLREQGFSDEAVEFALEKREKSQRQLEREGWDAVVAEFLVRYQGRTREEMSDAGLEEEAISIVEKYAPMLAECRHRVLLQHGDQQADFEAQAAEQGAMRGSRNSFQAHLQARLHSLLRQEGFDISTLRYFAGSSRYLTSRELARDGLSLTAMGLEIPNQTFNPPLEQYADPLDLETEGIVTQANRASRRLWLGMKYWNGLPVLTKARMISKPTKRIWLGAHELGLIVRGNRAGEVKPLTRVGECMVVSTDLGVMEVRECVERKVGGLVLCRIW